MLRESSRLQSRAHELFREAAAAQRVCGGCGNPGPWHPHHVILEQILDREGRPLYNPMNALRLCWGCHADHHGAHKIKVRQLRDENVRYAVWMFGLRGVALLRRYYDDESDPDPRLLLYERTLEFHGDR